MQTENMWKLFPLHLEQKINSLLYEAEPNSTKAYQLYKACKNEHLWRNSFELFSVHLADFFSQPPQLRHKSYFDNFLDRPMNRTIFEQFELSFRSAKINPKFLIDIAHWAHESIRVNCRTESPVASTDILTKTLEHITSPPEHEKDNNIEFEDFCAAWKKVVFRLFGKKYDQEFERILQEIHWLKEHYRQLENKTDEKSVVTEKKTIYLTQTEIDWTEEIFQAVQLLQRPPKYPLSRGPQKSQLIDLHRAAILYDLVLETTKPELLKHRDVIREQVVNICAHLLKNCQR